MDLIRPVVPARPSWRSRLRRSAPYAVAATALALALSGCIKLDMDLDIASDNTIDGAIVFAVDKSLLTLGGGDPEDAFGDALTDAPFPTEGTGGGEVRTEVYDEDGKYGSRFIFTDMPLDAFNDEDLSITREGDFFVVTGTLDTTEGSGTDGTDGSGGSESPAPFPSELLGGFDVSVSMTFPGEVVEHTGTLEGTTVTWRPEGAEPIQISARAKATADSGPLGLASSSSMLMYGGIALATLLVGGLLVFLLVRRRSTPAPAGVPAEAVAYPAAGAAAPAVFTPDGAAAGPVPGTAPTPEASPVPGFEPQPTLILPDEQPTAAPVVPDAAVPEAPVVPEAPQVWTPEPEAPAPVAEAPQVWTPEPEAPAPDAPAEGQDPASPPGPVPPA